MDLNLLANCEGSLQRFHLLGNPDAQLAQEIASFLNVPLVKTRCPAEYYRSSDANSDANVTNAQRTDR
tara:strand:+ start:3498 stop:3701 length:204 start_codon:yes stop_codon:yes gene_type:complete